MSGRFSIPLNESVSEIEVKKSLFICHLNHADSASKAKQYIESIRNKFPDAGHHCWAFQTEQPGSTRSIGCSDDGEPHGTAGKPILNILCHSNVGELVAVVTRYYGGTKLGTGGLARAYGDSVKASLEQLKTKEKIPWCQTTIEFEYSLQSMIEKALETTSSEIIELQFSETVKMVFRYDEQRYEELSQQLTNLSKGKLNLKNPF